MSETLLESPKTMSRNLDTQELLVQLRSNISDIYEEARILEENGAPNEMVNKRVNAIGLLPGVRVIEERDFRDDFDYRCVEFIFGEVCREDWARIGWTVKTTPTLWKYPFTFLHMADYQLVSAPQRGDIVGYGSIHDGEPWLEHYGMYLSGERVLSKFGRGPIATHHLELISASPDKNKGYWGDRYWFFRKAPPSDLAEAA